MVCYTYEIRLNGHSGFFWSFTITEKKKSDCGHSETVKKYTTELVGRLTDMKILWILEVI